MYMYVHVRVCGKREMGRIWKRKESVGEGERKGEEEKGVMEEGEG